MIINIILDELIAISNVSMKNYRKKKSLELFDAHTNVDKRRKIRLVFLNVKPNMCNYFPGSYPSASTSWRAALSLSVILSIVFFLLFAYSLDRFSRRLSMYILEASV